MDLLVLIPGVLIGWLVPNAIAFRIRKGTLLRLWLALAAFMAVLLSGAIVFGGLDTDPATENSHLPIRLLFWVLLALTAIADCLLVWGLRRRGAERGIVRVSRRAIFIVCLVAQVVTLSLAYSLPL
jgi:hypothetical protein